MAVALTAQAQTKVDTLKTKMVIQLSNAGLNEEIIKDKIQASISPGIYYYKGNPNNFIELEASEYAKTKMSAKVLTPTTDGATKERIRTTMGSEKANLQIAENNPVFYFCFNKSTSNNFDINGTQSFSFDSATNPNEFLLIKFAATRNNRQVVTGSWNDYTEMSVGIDDRNKVALRHEKISKGIYKVYAGRPLDKGEYCFIYAGRTASSKTASLQRVYDFGITRPYDTSEYTERLPVERKSL